MHEFFLPEKSCYNAVCVWREHAELKKQHDPGKQTDGYRDALSGRIFITGVCVWREHAELKKQHDPGKQTDGYRDALSGRISITGVCVWREHAELNIEGEAI